MTPSHNGYSMNNDKYMEKVATDDHKASILSFIFIAVSGHGNNILQEATFKLPEKDGTMDIFSERTLLSNLLKDYNTFARPVRRNNTVPVKISLELERIESLVTKSQVLKSSGLLTITWQDDQLKWNPNIYGGLSFVMLPANVIWLPRIVLLNTADRELYKNIWSGNTMVSVEYTGCIKWHIHTAFESRCHVTIMRYPFDEQYCELVFGSMDYNVNQIKLTINKHMAKARLLNECEGNSEWTVLDGKVTKRSGEAIHFILKLKRKALFHMVNIIAPSFMLSGLVLLVFQLPADSGEKISLGITLLLSFSVLILMIAESLPVTSEAVPLIVLYLIFIMGLTTLAVVISTVVLSFHHQHPVTPPPKWLRILILQMMGRLCCKLKLMNSRTFDSAENTPCDNKESEYMYQCRTLERLSQAACEEKNVEKMHTVLMAFVVHTFLLDVKEKKKRVESEEETQYLVEQWKTMAVILDKFSFWSFLVLILVGSPGLYFCFAEAESPLCDYF